MDWFTLALMSAITLAAADALTKKFLPTYRGWELLVIRIGVPALLLLPVMFIYPIPPVPAAFGGLMAILIPLEIAAMLLYMIAIRDCPLYLTLPYLSFTPVFNVLTAYLFLGETVSWRGFAGICFVVSGAYILNLNQNNRGTWRAPLSAITRERGSRLMLSAAAIYSVTSVLSKRAMGYATPESFGPFYYTLIGVVLLVLTAAVKPGSLRVLGQRPVQHLIIGTLMAVMVCTHFLAIARVEVAYMISVKRSSLLFGILFGALLFKERHTVRHLAAGTLMLIGVWMIAT
jgi:drug/metabolite transporter (DMT)-like permease